MVVREPTHEQSRNAYDLYDILVAHPEGVTYLGIGAETGWERQKVYKVVQVLRDLLSAQDEDMSVPCDPDPDYWQGPWLYRLIGGNHITDPEQTAWPINRIEDTERRIMTIKHVMDAAVKATDGRTQVGKKARIWSLHLQRAQEDIAILDGEDKLF